MSWGPALCFVCAGVILTTILWVGATDPIRSERRAIKRRAKAAIKRRKKLRILNRQLNRLKPGAFQIRSFDETRR